MEFFVDPLKADFEDLLGRFQQTESVRYEEFSEIWRKMDFSSIFYGKMSGKEIRNFCRLVLTTAYPYFLSPYTFQIRVGGLYLLYGLYHAQLTSPKEKIRLALKDWDDVKKFQQDAIMAQHLDVVYVLRKLFSSKAFCFAAMPKQLFYTMKKNLKKSEVCEEFRERPERVRDLVNVDALEEMMNVQQHYETMKAGIAGSRGQMDSAINLIRQDLVPQLRSTVVEYHKWQKENTASTKEAAGNVNTEAGEGPSVQQECSRRAELLASIKSKSYGQLIEVPQSRRHRQVEMDTSGSGTDPGLEVSRRRKPPSLKARTTKTLIEEGNEEVESMEFTRQWRLTVPEDRPAGRKNTRKRFKW